MKDHLVFAAKSNDLELKLEKAIKNLEAIAQRRLSQPKTGKSSNLQLDIDMVDPRPSNRLVYSQSQL